MMAVCCCAQACEFSLRLGVRFDPLQNFDPEDFTVLYVYCGMTYRNFHAKVKLNYFRKVGKIQMRDSLGV